MKHKNIGVTKGKILSAFVENDRKCFSVSDTFLHFPKLSENAIHIQLTRMIGDGQTHAYCDNDFGKEKMIDKFLSRDKMQNELKLCFGHLINETTKTSKRKL